MRRLIQAAIPLIVTVTAAVGAPIAYQLPPETATLAPGPNHDDVMANCGACHSADYITAQPRTFPDPKAFWTAEVAKMQKAYGAPIDDAAVPKIVEYLASTYGR